MNHAEYAAAFAAAKLLGGMELVAMLLAAEEARGANKSKGPIGPFVEAECLTAAVGANTPEVADAWLHMAWLAANQFATYEAFTNALDTFDDTFVD